MPEDGVIVDGIGILAGENHLDQDGEDPPQLFEVFAVVENVNPIEVVVLVSHDGEDLDSGFFLRKDPDKASVDESKAFVLG